MLTAHAVIRHLREWPFIVPLRDERDMPLLFPTEREAWIYAEAVDETTKWEHTVVKVDLMYHGIKL